MLTAAAVAADGRAHSLTLNVPAMSVLVLRHLDSQTGVGEVTPPAPADRLIERVWPNPLEGGAARVAPSRLAVESDVRVTILDTRGRLVATLPVERLSAGPHERSWDGTDGTRRRLPAGRLPGADGSGRRERRAEDHPEPVTRTLAPRPGTT